MNSFPDSGGAVRRILERLQTEEDAARNPRSLPRECYTSPDFFEFERTAVFARSWICVGHEQQIPQPGDCLSAAPAGEPVFVVRAEDGTVGAFSAVCQHRGQVLACPSGNTGRVFRCPLHSWTYDLHGRLVGAPRMGDAATVRALRASVRLPPVRLESWHGFLFVNLDPAAPALAPGLAKVEPFWDGYRDADLVCVPPRMAEAALPWNWKTHLENFTDAYHPEFVHTGTHDFAPSVHPAGGVRFTPMAPGDNAIVRSVPMLRPDGGMMRDGWGEPPAFPPIAALDADQRQRLTFVMIPPGLTMVFTPNSIAYALLIPAGAEETYASNDRVTAGGWLLPRSTVALPDFAERAAVVQEGAAKVWAQDVPVNLAMQAGKRSAFAPTGAYGPLETTLVQFNMWLLDAYRRGAGPSAASRDAAALAS